MNYKMMGRLIALILAMEAVFMLPALLICLYDGRLPSAYGFLYTIGILLVAAGALALLLIARLLVEKAAEYCRKQESEVRCQSCIYHVADCISDRPADRTYDCMRDNNCRYK